MEEAGVWNGEAIEGFVVQTHWAKYPFGDSAKDGQRRAFWVKDESDRLGGDMEDVSQFPALMVVLRYVLGKLPPTSFAVILV